MILGLETHFVLSVMEFRYLMFQPSVQEIECNLSPKSVSFFSKRCFACTQPSSQAGLEPTSSPGGSFLPVSGSDRKKRDLGCWKRGLSQAKLHNSGILRIGNGASALRLSKPCTPFPLLSQVGARFHFQKSSW